jgi:hypothetical protein
MSLVFVDCEASGPCPGMGDLTEFGAVIHKTKKTFYGDLRGKTPFGIVLTFKHFLDFIQENCPTRPVFVSDNPAFDWQWINLYFHHTLGMNPFGWSARRIGDYYAGLKGNFNRSTDWKRLRVTKHDHHPVNDAMGNVEAFDKMELNRKTKANKEACKEEIDRIFIEKRPMTGGTGDYKMPKGAIYL